MWVSAYYAFGDNADVKTRVAAGNRIGIEIRHKFEGSVLLVLSPADALLLSDALRDELTRMPGPLTPEGEP